MRRKCVCFLIGAMMLGMVGCGSKAEPISATIKDEQGNVQEMTVSDLVSLKESNSAKYNSQFAATRQTRVLSLVSTVKEINGPYTYNDACAPYSYTAYVVELDGGWSIRVDQNARILEQLDVGMKIEVTDIGIAETNTVGNEVALVGRSEYSYTQGGLHYVTPGDDPKATEIEIVE